MSFHKHILNDLESALQEIIQTSATAPQVVEKFLKSRRKWGSRDRKFFAAAVYNTVRWFRRNAFLLGSLDYQSTAPLHLWAAGELFQGSEVPEDLAQLKSTVDANRELLLAAPLAIRESLADWLDEVGQAQLGSQWSSVVQAMNFEAPVDLRVNVSVTSVGELLAKLESEGVEAERIPKLKNALTLKVRKTITGTLAFKQGMFEIQDRSSQLVVPFMECQKGDLVIDACAGAGGKTLQLLDEVQGLRKVVAMDNSKTRLDRLRPRLERRSGVHVDYQVIENPESLKPWLGKADRVLIDAPCSATGTFRRNPDRKWKLLPEELLHVQATQKQILSDYSKLVKPGGFLIYSTCSILPAENENQVRYFLAQNSNWTLVEEKHVYPDQSDGDGFYMARLKSV